MYFSAKIQTSLNLVRESFVFGAKIQTLVFSPNGPNIQQPFLFWRERSNFDVGSAQ